MTHLDNPKLPKVHSYIDVPVAVGVEDFSKVPTVLVAASDATDKVKQYADFVCTGSNDDATIESAIDSLPTSGGRVVLSEGTFTFGSSLNIMKSNITLEGSGFATLIQGAISGNYILVGDGSTALSNIKICNLRINGGGLDTVLSGINIYGGLNYEISNCIIENCFVEGCWSYDIVAYYLIKSNIIGNVCQTSHYEGMGIFDSNNNVIARNKFISNGGNGFLSMDSNNNIMVGNIFQSNDSHGINLDSSNYNILIGNIFKDNSQSANNSYDDIILGSSNYNVISSNSMVATATNKTRYAVNESGSDYNLVIGNFCTGQVSGKINLTGANSLAVNNLEV